MKIRIGNDFEYAWKLTNSEDSAPIDLNTAIDMTVTARVHRVRVNVPYDIVGNDTLLFKFNRNICSVVGDYNLELNYFLPDTNLAPKDREKTIDIDAFTIVSRTAQADNVKFITSTSDIAMAFKGEKGDKGDTGDMPNIIMNINEQGHLIATITNK